MATYTSQYPPAQSDTYVKSTTKLSTGYWAYFATDPALSLTGSWGNNSWLCPRWTTTNQRFHIDLGSSKVIRSIYYENNHNTGASTNVGVENFTFWGSNTGAGTFDDLVYANDEGWTQLTVSQNTFDQHKAENAVDPKYIVVTNTTAYRYYAFKFADNWGHAEYMGVRRIELQTEDTSEILLEFSETLSIADTMATSGTLAKAETLSIADTKITSGSLGFIETLSIVDSWSGLLAFFETLSITDTVAMGGSLNVSEIISIIDSFIRWIEHPIYTEPTKVNVSYTEPAKSNPIYTEPTKGHPVYTEPTKKIKLD